MLTIPVDTRAITATSAGCARRGVGGNTWRGRGSILAAEDDRRSSILQLNTEGLTESKISVNKQLVYKHKALVIILQETHCTTADKIVIPNFSLVGSVLSRKHGLATFVHKRLEWTLVDQPPEQSETEWLCVVFHRWNVGTNPDLTFASVGHDDRLPDGHVLGKFPRSQPLPSLITPLRLKVPAQAIR